ncbi:MAG: SRPBCC domain-containing protein [Kofleriaceae bacterium]
MKTTNLELSRQIPASPDDVYAVWLDPQCAGGPWYSPQTDGMDSKIIFDAKVDGLFYHRVTNTGYGQTWTHYGRFTNLESGKRVEHTWVCEATKGLESTVTVTFEAHDGGTLVKIVHAGFPDDEEGRGQDMGWKWILGQLAETVQKRKS